MISTLTQTRLPRNRFQQFLGATTAIFLASSMASMALSAAEKEIEVFTLSLFSKTYINSSSVEINIAAQAALAVTSKAPSAIVTASLKKAPTYAPGIAAVALRKAYGTEGLTSPASFTTQKKKDSDANKIITTAIKSALTVSGNPQARADEAAAVTAIAVNTVRDLPTAGVGTALSPLQVIVRGAVKAALVAKTGGADGLDGVITGAVSQYAGGDNETLAAPGEDTIDGKSGDAAVRAILSTAGKNASKKLVEIGRAAGYAFASVYLATTGSDIGLTDFLIGNQLAISRAIVSALSAKQKDESGILFTQISVSVNLGIAAAYGGSQALGSNGVNDFAYNNGQGTPVTDTVGL